jgi:hypothetical protein
VYGAHLSRDTWNEILGLEKNVSILKFFKPLLREKRKKILPTESDQLI